MTFGEDQLRTKWIELYCRVRARGRDICEVKKAEMVRHRSPMHDPNLKFGENLYRPLGAHKTVSNLPTTFGQTDLPIKKEQLGHS